MATTDPPPRSRESLSVDVARALAATLVVAVWFACRFIVPRLEANLMDAGARPSPMMHGILIASHAVVKYFWWIAPILVLGIFFSGRPRPEAHESPY